MVDGVNKVVWLNGMPRSGTTWMSQVLAASRKVLLKYCPHFSYEFKGRLTETSSQTDWQAVFEELTVVQSEYLDQQHLRKNGLVPKFNHEAKPTHLVVKSTRFHHLNKTMLAQNPNVTMIHMVRDPRNCIASWLSHPTEFPMNADKSQEWRSGNCRKDSPGEYWGFDDWKSVTRDALDLQKQFPKQCLVVSYDQLIQHIETEMAEIFKFCALPLDLSVLQFIRLSQSKHNSNRHAVYKDLNKLTHWENVLDKKIADAIATEVTGSELESFLQP